MISIEIRDTKETDRLLAELPVQLREKVLKKALREAAKLVRDEARRRAPVGPKTGIGDVPLKRNIVHKASSRENRVTGRVQTKGRANVYGAALEFGHRMFIKGQLQGGRMVAPSPFLRPAAEHTERHVENKIQGILRQHLVHIARGTPLA